MGNWGLFHTEISGVMDPCGLGPTSYTIPMMPPVGAPINWKNLIPWDVSRSRGPGPVRRLAFFLGWEQIGIFRIQWRGGHIPWSYLVFALTKTGPKWLKHDWTIQSLQSWKLKMKTGWMNHISPKPQIKIKFLKQWGIPRGMPLLPYILWGWGQAMSLFVESEPFGREDPSHGSHRHSECNVWKNTPPKNLTCLLKTCGWKRILTFLTSPSFIRGDSLVFRGLYIAQSLVFWVNMEPYYSLTFLA